MTDFIGDIEDIMISLTTDLCICYVSCFFQSVFNNRLNSFFNTNVALTDRELNAVNMPIKFILGSNIKEIT